MSYCQLIEYTPTEAIQNGVLTLPLFITELLPWAILVLLIQVPLCCFDTFLSNFPPPHANGYHVFLASYQSHHHFNPLKINVPVSKIELRTDYVLSEHMGLFSENNSFKKMKTNAGILPTTFSGLSMRKRGNSYPKEEDRLLREPFIPEGGDEHYPSPHVSLKSAPFISSRERRTKFSQEAPEGTTARTETAVPALSPQLPQALPFIGRHRQRPNFCKGSLPILQLHSKSQTFFIPNTASFLHHN